MLLENNGMKSVGKGSRYIKIKYFFITDKIKIEEMRVTYYPTEKMLADFYTKPLQGTLFIVHRNKLMGILPEEFPQYYKEYEAFMIALMD